MTPLAFYACVSSIPSKPPVFPTFSFPRSSFVVVRFLNGISEKSKACSTTLIFRVR
jgi:hypothetical protein